MHKLARQVRFSVNPFLDESEIGFNSHCSKPAGKGLAMFFALRVELCSVPDEDTGFVVNVVEIDRVIRSLVVPVFDEIIGRCFRRGRHVSLAKTGELLMISQSILREYFDEIEICDLRLDLNPWRKFGIFFEEGAGMFYYAEKFEFAAMHKLWNDKFGADDNYRMFGKCANPTGHGHNYTAEFCVVIDDGDVEGFNAGEYERIIKEGFVDVVDHKNLNADVEFFSENNPTVENIARFGYQRLKGKFGKGRLEKVTIWETERTCCSYRE